MGENDKSVKVNEITMERQTMNSFTRVYVSSHDKKFDALKKEALDLFKKAKEEDWKRAFLLMELLDDYYDSVCG